MPGLPGLALLIGGWMTTECNSASDSRDRRTGKISSVVLAVLGTAACMVCVVLTWQAQTPPPNYDIAELLKQNPQDYALSFGHFLDLTPQAMGAFKGPLLLTGIAFALGTIVNFFLRRAGRAFAGNLVLTGMSVALLLAAYQGLNVFSPVLSSQVLARAIEAHWQPGAIIEDNGDYEAASSVNYYTHRQLRILNGQCNNIWYGSKFPDAPAIFDDDNSLEDLWVSNHVVFLVIDGKARPGPEIGNKCPQTERVPRYVTEPAVCVIAQSGGKMVLTNALTLCLDQRLRR